MRHIIGSISVLIGLLFWNGSLRAAERVWDPSRSAPSTRRMADRLEKIVRATDPLQNPFMSEGRAQAYAAQTANARDEIERLSAFSNWALELLKAGHIDEAIAKFEELDKAYAVSRAVGSKNRAFLRNAQALCYLRQGEVDNCLQNHGPESCLFPIKGGGVHQNQRGSRKAIEVLSNSLNLVPSDLRARWLLNIAFMTLGEYPEKVPNQFLIDPKFFQSDYDLKPFPNVAAGVGLDIESLAGGCIAEDFDGDGYLDLMVSSWDVRGQLRFFHNNADGTFSERTEAAGLVGEIGGLNIIQTDYNNDGFPDVLVLRGAWMGEAGCYPNSLLKNNGDGTFTDVTEEAGLLSFHPTQAGVWFDYNNDGWLDLYIGNESSGPNSHPCELYRNNRDGTFTECAAAVGVASLGFVKGVTAGDFNNDGLPDLYLSRLGQPNILYRNDGPQPGTTNGWKFTDVAAAAGVTEPLMSFPTWFFDFDNDGWLDILVTGYGIRGVGDIAADYMGEPNTGEKMRLYRNNRDGTFSDVTKEAHLYKIVHAMGSNFGDLDNDGYLDLYFGTGDPDFATLIPNRMFRNAEGKYFQEVTTAGGFGNLQKGHAVAFADFDNDGDQDIFEVMGGAYASDLAHSVLFQNPGFGNHWITLKLEGVKSNRAALGARIKVTVQTPAGDRVIYKTVSTGGSFGASPLRQEIGLGQAQAIKSVEVFWPTTKQTQVFPNVGLDQIYRLTEGSPALAPIRLKTFSLKAAPAESDHAHRHHGG